MLTLEQITVTPRGTSRPILDRLSFALPQGQFAVLVGHNGSGKSTLLKTLLGEHAPEQGRIVVRGRDITAESPTRRASCLSVVAQDITKNTVAGMTVFEHMVLSLRRGLSYRFQKFRQQRSDFQNVLRQWEMEDYLDTPMHNLSGGQRQRLALMLACLKTPSLLLLDEHTSALDPRSAQTIMAETYRYATENHLTTLMVTHSITDALCYGERLLVMNQGQIVQDFHGEAKKALTRENLFHFFAEGGCS